MLRVVSSRKICTTIVRRCRGGSVLEEIFAELAACDVAQRSAQPTPQVDFARREKCRGDFNSGAGKSNAVTSPGRSPESEDRDIRAETSKQKHLQRQLQEVWDRVAMAKVEEEKEEGVRRRSRYVVSPPAILHHSTAELVQENSPQHFVPAEDSSGKLSALPHVESPGSVAVVTLVGRVLSAVGSHGSSETSRDDRDLLTDEDELHARFLVEYNVPFRTLKPVVVQVRCYGATLLSFAERYVKKGDVVHVLGHVLPLEVRSPEDPVLCVCALPFGGNVSVVLGTECVAE
ncbi:hypothetical protein, conserved [Trypanosoma brucei gambiense DAL972]|uniref:Uncharacterized protein n=1 Tax=Trypanosoma brucei gambiense (strain MHOM/CI/86/DAL972) TaxID=679716 RepID=C9ZQN9_TRYB9|nr:hypothetical protein, conserved [Trypanosoma brucei gambiense DAL972]CBH11719.1 hypothetical protein, conserved [Trypanosoma brucei gambiense DAL972]|eukprot:XP_011774004.1 hypothetical protein, conserved [Trypanosoma brucei gambiense DAL972]